MNLDFSKCKTKEDVDKVYKESNLKKIADKLKKELSAESVEISIDE